MLEKRKKGKKRTGPAHGHFVSLFSVPFKKKGKKEKKERRKRLPGKLGTDKRNIFLCTLLGKGKKKRRGTVPARTLWRCHNVPRIFEF